MIAYTIINTALHESGWLNAIEQSRTNPTRNILHVTFMFHAIIIDLHVLHSMHVIMLMYMHVSCNMHEFRTFSMLHETCMYINMITCMNFGRFPCMLHACNMYTT